MYMYVSFYKPLFKNPFCPLNLDLFLTDGITINLSPLILHLCSVGSDITSYMGLQQEIVIFFPYSSIFYTHFRSSKENSLNEMVL